MASGLSAWPSCSRVDRRARRTMPRLRASSVGSARKFADIRPPTPSTLLPAGVLAVFPAGTLAVFHVKQAAGIVSPPCPRHPGPRQARRRLHRHAPRHPRTPASARVTIVALEHPRADHAGGIHTAGCAREVHAVMPAASTREQRATLGRAVVLAASAPSLRAASQTPGAPQRFCARQACAFHVKPGRNAMTPTTPDDH